ncbi:DUF4097 family beta strand repeat-containing protein [Woeseia oceani]|uniref:hypothetical protein n=1 Tax=Woeseia oceani TaxID=1548547 RepID=UPI000A8AFC2E|nr:hypothetical protein [Woeseia oceani]
MLTPSVLPRSLLGLVLMCLAGTALAANLNKSIRIDDGTETGGRSTVNGSITVGSNAVISGSLSTVNGSITVDRDSQVEDVETVNGGIRLASGVMADDLESVNGNIRLGENVRVTGNISIVNGKIEIASGGTVADDVSNVNGDITVYRSDIGGDVSTVNGDVTLTDNSVVRGNLIVEKPGGWRWSEKNQRKPRVIVGPGTQILGKIQLEREVELFISESATVSTVSGEMSLNDAVRFSGARP